MRHSQKGEVSPIIEYLTTAYGNVKRMHSRRNADGNVKQTLLKSSLPTGSFKKREEPTGQSHAKSRSHSPTRI